MENEIKQVYKTLTGGKVIGSNNFIISKNHFSSILRDRFIAELTKLGIKWNGTDTTFEKLLGQKDTGNQTTILAQKDTLNTQLKNDGFSIGIDIQKISDLPDCLDYWEDEFYRTKFTPQEIGYCVSKQNVKETFAGIYSCKEAIIKCNNNLTWSNIAVSYDTNGKPLFENYYLSISHSGENAIAIAINNENNVAGSEKNDINSSNSLTPREGKIISFQQEKFKSNIILFILMLIIIAYLIFRDFL